MLNSFRKDLAVQLETVERKHCDSCHKSNGDRVRLACGHSVCGDCVATGVCWICSPLMDTKSNRRKTEGAGNSSVLPTSPDTLQISVNQRQRLSEQLRVEKELFPECIQAPVKYFNKRKSLNVLKRGKENRHTTIFPGEETSFSRELAMNKSRNYVQEWLNKQPNASFGPQSRSPFSNLKVNTHHNQPTHSTSVKGKQKENAPAISTRQSNRKKSRLKQPSTVNPIGLENYLRPLEKSENKVWSAKRLKQEFDDTSKDVSHQREGQQPCGENVVVIDDICFTIVDSPEQIVDKDELALLEVQKASANESDTLITDKGHSVNDEASNKHDEGKMSYVPFYKKGPLIENCAQCVTQIQDVSKHNPHDAIKKFSDFSITVENKSFITTISVVDCNPIHSDKKQSTSVQTEEAQELFLGFEQPSQKETVSLISKIKQYIENEENYGKNQVAKTESQDNLCTDFIWETQDGTNKADKNVEQENNMLPAGHASEHEFGVLTELDGAGFQNKRKRGGRGATPDSNNSSDKENCDPDRKKRGDAKKKRKNK